MIDTPMGTTLPFPSSKGRLNRPGHVLDQRLNIVCTKCNNGWMSRLQFAAKLLLTPLLKGEWPDLTPEHQRTLAAWATMFTMVYEFSDLRTLATPYAHREHLRLTREPPPAWNVWIGRLNGTVWQGKCHHKGVGLHPPETAFQVVNKCNTQSTLFGLGAVIFYTLSTTDDFWSIDPMGYGSLINMEPIWPTQDYSVPRPDHVIIDAEADKIGHMLESYVRDQFSAQTHRMF